MSSNEQTARHAETLEHMARYRRDGRSETRSVADLAEAEACEAGAEVLRRATADYVDWGSGEALAMAALDQYPIVDGLPKSTSVVYRIHQLGRAYNAARERVDAAEVMDTLTERAQWYRDGCEGLEDREGYYASGDCARDAASDLETALSKIRVLEAAAAAVLQRPADNHHNAAACPYCRPTLDEEVATVATLVRTVNDQARRLVEAEARQAEVPDLIRAAATNAIVDGHTRTAERIITRFQRAD